MKSTRFPNQPNGTWKQTVEEVGAQVAHVPEQLSQCVEERPVSSLFAAFGVGVVAGVGLVALYYGSCQQKSSYETFTRRMSDAIRDALPQSLMARS